MFIRVSEHAKDMFIKRHSDKQAYKFSVIKNEKNEAIMFNKLIKLIFDLYENLEGLEVVEKFNSADRKQGEPVILLEVENPEVCTTIREYLESNNIEYIHQRVGCAVGIHSGIKACGLFFVKNY